MWYCEVYAQLLSHHTYTHLQQTFHHGFPYQPTCLAYDPVQQLLAVGTQNGGVLLYPITVLLALIVIIISVIF